jgi:hypothetical protein
MSGKKLSVRTNEANPNHHLWNNHGTWWCHFTLHENGLTKHRQRLSLRTADLGQARQRRDELLARYEDAPAELETAQFALEVA